MGDDLLRKFSQVEEKTIADCTLTLEERCAVDHFDSHHSHNQDGRFVVPLPKRSMAPKPGESPSQAVRCFLSLKGPCIPTEYFLRYRKEHAEEVPPADLEKSREEVVFYLTIHIVRKESSTTTKDSGCVRCLSSYLYWSIPQLHSDGRANSTCSTRRRFDSFQMSLCCI